MIPVPLGNESVCLDYNQIHFIAAEINAVSFNFGILMLVIGLGFGALFIYLWDRRGG